MTLLHFITVLSKIGQTFKVYFWRYIYFRSLFLSTRDFIFPHYQEKTCSISMSDIIKDFLRST